MAKTNPTIEHYNRIMKDLQDKTYKPVYVLAGEESYFIDQISSYIAQNVLSQDEQEFNLKTLYGKDVTIQQVLVEARRFPMMSKWQVIVVKEAQNIDIGDGENGKEEKLLEKYAENPLLSTILVLCFKGKGLDKRSKLSKLLSQTGEVFESEPFKSYNTDIIDWITEYLKGKNYSIESDAARLLVQASGEELTKITGELDTLILMLPKGASEIKAEHVETLGVNKDFNSFELCNAFLQKDEFKIFRIIRYFDKNPRNFNLQLTLGAVFSQFTKLFAYQMLRLKYKNATIPDEDLQNSVGVHPFVIKNEYAPAALKFSTQKVAQIISAIRKCDIRSKSSENAAVTDGELLKELAYAIIYL